MTLETVRVRPPEPSWTEVMEKLRDQVGNQVSIHYASDGSQGIRAGILTDVKPFQSVRIDGFEIPFIFAPLKTSAFMLNMKAGRIESSPAGLM